MSKKLGLLGIFFLLTSACLPGISLTYSDTPTAIVIKATTAPPPTLTPNPVPPTATAAPAGINHVNIYLVAVGDNGISGKQIGCGDSLVPVEVQIEPTLGVLRAALNKLFELEGQDHYGQSGLYNALYLSHLSINDVAVINRKAIIKLQGQIVTGGECDIPRIEEQLRATALQFNTVDSVSITVNGESLDELLDLSG
jgi:hypothetical protein